jgi:hypothetical protein
MEIKFDEVSVKGLETSPYAAALAGLRANEARYIWNKFKRPFETYSAEARTELMQDIEELLQEERKLSFAARPLEVAQMYLEENILWTWVFYEDGLSINILYEMNNPKKRAVGLKLSEGMPVPAELEDRFKFARQKSKLAGTIRGSFFTLKKDHTVLMQRWLNQLNEGK